MIINWLKDLFGAPKIHNTPIDIVELPTAYVEIRSSNENYRDALEHIMKICDQSSTRTKRIKWIEHRAKCALNGGNWRNIAYPKNRSRTRVDSLGGEV